MHHVIPIHFRYMLLSLVVDMPHCDCHLYMMMIDSRCKITHGLVKVQQSICKGSISSFVHSVDYQDH